MARSQHLSKVSMAEHLWQCHETNTLRSSTSQIHGHSAGVVQGGFIPPPLGVKVDQHDVMTLLKYNF
jgi:hypothetical protein